MKQSRSYWGTKLLWSLKSMYFLEIPNLHCLTGKTEEAINREFPEVSNVWIGITFVNSQRKSKFVEYYIESEFSPPSTNKDV